MEKNWTSNQTFQLTQSFLSLALSPKPTQSNEPIPKQRARKASQESISSNLSNKLVHVEDDITEI